MQVKVWVAAALVMTTVSASGAAWLVSTYQAAQLERTRTALAEAEQRHTAWQLRQAEAASMAMYQAQRRGDALTQALHAARREAAQLKQERDDAISETTDGRDCLREPALRVLDGAPGLRVQLPEPTGGAVAADAGRVATDADLAGWALDAGAAYAECARRHNALIRWHADPEGPQ